MTFPNFLIVGAARSGTTSLYNYLDSHPDVFMCPVREPSFFAFEGQAPDYRGPGDMDYLMRTGKAATDSAAYGALFDGVRDEKAIGEASPLYLYVSKAAERIKYHVGDARILMSLRNPVERGYSHFLRHCRSAKETAQSYEDALELEEYRRRLKWAPMWDYKSTGFYYEAVKRYFRLFGRQRVKVLLYDDLVQDASRVVKEVCDFLEVDASFSVDTSRTFNRGLVPRSMLVQKCLGVMTKEHAGKMLVKRLVPVAFLSGLRRRLEAKNLKRPLPLEPRVKAKLQQVYRHDVLKLQELLGRDLSGWLAS